MSLSQRGKVFASIAYKEDESIEHIIECCEKTHYKCYISPLHSPTSDERELKEHWHLLVVADTTKSLSQIEVSFVGLHCTAFFFVESKIGYARYLLHLDNPDKEQFENASVCQVNATDYDKLISKDKADNKIVLARERVLDIVFTYDDISYRDLVAYVRALHTAEHSEVTALMLAEVLTRAYAYKAVLIGG